MKEWCCHGLRDEKFRKILESVLTFGISGATIQFIRAKVL